MNRRSVLTMGVLGSGILLSGCLGTSSPGGGTEENGHFSQIDCPRFDENADRRVCHHRTGANTTIRLEPSFEKGDTREETLTFTLVNESGQSIEAGFGLWRLQYFRNGEWEWIQPIHSFLEGHSLPTDNSHTWTVNHDHTEDMRMRGRNSAINMRYPGPGVYSFSISVIANETIELVILFEIDGETPDLTPQTFEESESDNGDEIILSPDREYADDSLTTILFETTTDVSGKSISRPGLLQSDILSAGVSYLEYYDSVEVRAPDRWLDTTIERIRTWHRVDYAVRWNGREEPVSFQYGETGYQITIAPESTGD